MAEKAGTEARPTMALSPSPQIILTPISVVPKQSLGGKGRSQAGDWEQG